MCKDTENIKNLKKPINFWTTYSMFRRHENDIKYYFSIILTRMSIINNGRSLTLKSNSIPAYSSDGVVDVILIS